MDKRERRGCPNNQPLVVGKKEEIGAILPYAMKPHAVPSLPRIFHAKFLFFWHPKPDHISLVTIHN